MQLESFYFMFIISYRKGSGRNVRELEFQPTVSIISKQVISSQQERI